MKIDSTSSLLRVIQLFTFASALQNRRLLLPYLSQFAPFSLFPVAQRCLLFRRFRRARAVAVSAGQESPGEGNPGSPYPAPFPERKEVRQKFSEALESDRGNGQQTAGCVLTLFWVWVCARRLCARKQNCRRSVPH